jgi:G protein-coupled receptor GPR1
MLDLPSPLSTTNASHSHVYRDDLDDAAGFAPGKGAGGSLTGQQNHAILISAVSCASFSLLAALIALRWFVMMRRNFRHRLVMHLIISDTCKAIGYFVFPIVVFTRGPVASSSKFCQASGFLLEFAIEAADMAILMIAIHSILYVMRPNNGVGEGGLYTWRYWIYPAWLLPPLIAASLVFVKDGNSYVTAGTFCYLPKRPHWYRLALSWIPRWVIIGIILAMYLWIYFYVHRKLRAFDTLGESGPSSGSNSGWESRRKSTLTGDSEDVDERLEGDNADPPIRSPNLKAPSWKPQSPRSSHVGLPTTPDQLQPWDHMNFITSKPLQNMVPDTIPEEDRPAIEGRGSGWSGDTKLPSDENRQPSIFSTRKVSDLTIVHHATQPKDRMVSADDRAATHSKLGSRRLVDDPLRKTRMAIRKQLRFLFLYPIVYIIVWTIPFVVQVKMFNDYYVEHPVFGLSLTQTIMLSLQAGTDSILFSWTEKPWRRVDPGHTFSVPLRRHSQALLQRACPEKAERPPPSTDPATTHPPPKPARSAHWWEAEGRRRKDSVWLGTSALSENNTSPVLTRTRTRSRSPVKSLRHFHSRTKSVDRPLPSMIPGVEPLSPGERPRSAKRSTLAPVSSNASGRERRLSFQSHQSQHRQAFGLGTDPASPVKEDPDLE